MPPAYLQDVQSAQELLQGINTMQMQAGIMPGGMPVGGAPPIMAPTPGQMSSNISMQFQQQQQSLMAMTPPPAYGMGVTPVARPAPFDNAMMMPGVGLPPPQFGSGRMMHRQQAQRNTNSGISAISSGVDFATGVGADLALGAVGMAVGGPLGAAALPLAWNMFGGSNALSNTVGAPLKNVMQQRERAMQLQNSSIGFVRGGPDMSSSGAGLSMGASMQLQSNLMNMADSKGFQSETGGRFNRQDMMKITKMAGDMGMLAQSQSVDEISRNMRTVSKALANFMKVAGEPDVQEAMKSMGKFRSMGMTVDQGSQATRNARAFARMAGTDTQTMIQMGQQGAAAFQGVGLSAASGQNAGMAAQGMAAQAAGLMDPRRLAMAGGQQGIASAFTQAASGSATMDALLPAMLTRSNGQLSIDREKIQQLMSGRFDITQLTQMGARNVRQLGGREALMELSTRRRELQDEASASMGGMGSVLLPAMHAKAIMSQVPGMSLGGAFRTMGMGEQQARTMEQTLQDPRFYQRMRDQRRAEMRSQRGEIAEQRGETRQNARWQATRGLSNAWEGGSRTLGNAWNTYVREEFGEEDDIEEERLAQGGGNLIRVARQARTQTAVQRAQLRDRMRTREGRQTLLDRMSRTGSQAMRASREAEAEAEDGGLHTWSKHIIGPGGFGLSAAGRGGEYRRDTIERNAGLGTQISSFFGAGPDRAERETIGRNQVEMGRLFTANQDITRSERKRNREGLRQNMSGVLTGNSDERRSQMRGMLSTAAAAINKALEGNVAGGINIGQGARSKEALKAAVRTSMQGQGFTSSQINSALANDQFIEQAVDVGRRTRTDEQQTAVDNIVEGAGALNEGARIADVDAVRQEGEDARKSALSAIGVDVDDYFSNSTTSERRRLVDIMGGEGDVGDAQRKLMAAAAMERAAKESGDEDMARQAMALRESVRDQYSDEVYEEADRVVGDLSDISTSVATDIAENFKGKDDAEIEAALSAGKEGAIGGQVSILKEGARNLLGDEGAQAFVDAESNAGKLRALREHLRKGGDIQGLSEEDKAKIMDGDYDVTEILSKMEQSASEGAEIGAGGGLGSALGRAADGEYMSALGALGDAFTGAFSDESDDAASPAASGRFGEAVGTFSEASKLLLDAAKEMNTRRGVVDIAALVNEGRN